MRRFFLAFVVCWTVAGFSQASAQTKEGSSRTVDRPIVRPQEPEPINDRRDKDLPGTYTGHPKQSQPASRPGGVGAPTPGRREVHADRRKDNAVRQPPPTAVPLAPPVSDTLRK